MSSFLPRAGARSQPGALLGGYCSVTSQLLSCSWLFLVTIVFWAVLQLSAGARPAGRALQKGFMKIYGVQTFI